MLLVLWLVASLARSVTENLNAAWQAKGKQYLIISSETLLALNTKVAQLDSIRSEIDKESLLKELTLTYFERFHRMLRGEYQHEKSAAEDRALWPASRLQAEGYALLELAALPQGSLFQDRVMNFLIITAHLISILRYFASDLLPVAASPRIAFL